jgi:hypothetical protein
MDFVLIIPSGLHLKKNNNEKDKNINSDCFGYHHEQYIVSGKSAGTGIC